MAPWKQRMGLLQSRRPKGSERRGTLNPINPRSESLQLCAHVLKQKANPYPGLLAELGRCGTEHKRNHTLGDFLGGVLHRLFQGLFTYWSVCVTTSIGAKSDLPQNYKGLIAHLFGTFPEFRALC